MIEESKQGEVEDKLVRMKGLNFDIQMNYKKVKDIPAERFPDQSQSYFLLKKDVPIKHVGHDESKAQAGINPNSTLSYDHFINYYCDFDAVAEQHQSEEFKSVIRPTQ